MAKVLSVSSRLRTGYYKTSTTSFFTPSKLFEAQMTELFDEVWPTVTAMKMLRWQVRGYYEEYCIDNNSRLTQKFVEREDVTNRPNLYRSCIDESWEDAEFRISKNLLTNIFACYEGWVENILRLLNVQDVQRKAVCFQNPTNKPQNYQTLLSEMNIGGCADLETAFYNRYQLKSKLYDYSKLDNWFLYYRYFKECRNAIIHNGGQTTQRCIDAFNNMKILTVSDVNVEELPQTFVTNLGDPIRISLRGVVGFSQIILRIVSTLDVELIKAKTADEYFANRIFEEIKGRRTLPTIEDLKIRSIKSLVSKGRFLSPQDVDAVYRILKRWNVVI